MAGRKFSRREALRAGGAALAFFNVVPGRVLGINGTPGSNDEVRVAIIGLGGRAGGVVADCRGLQGLRIVAVADCFTPRIGAFINRHGANQGWKGYQDFRKMIETEKPDAVMVETTTHARAWITILAMQMGCDAYIEKPMSLTIGEGRHMVAAARKYRRVTQVGTQQRSTPLNNWASDLVKNGALGKVHTVLAPNFVGPSLWADQPEAPMPEGADGNWWDVWTNQAVLRPYHPQLQFGWPKWRDYDGGGECFGVTGWGAHSYDQVNRALGTDDTGPVEIVLEEKVRVSNTGKFSKPRGDEDTGSDYHSMAQPVIGPRAKVTMRFASGTALKLHLDGDTGPGLGAIFIGQKGKLEINRNKISADPVELINGAEDPGPNLERGTPLHVENWIECIKSRKPCRADIEIGQRATTLCYLVNIARHVGKVGEVLRWDPIAERFTNCEEGNQLLDLPRRKGWELSPLT